MDKNAARQGKDLRLVLKPAERRREDKTVVVAPEVGAGGILFGVVVVLKTESFIVDEDFPLHSVVHHHLALLPM